MHRRFIHIGSILLGLVLLTAACATPQASSPQVTSSPVVSSTQTVAASPTTEPTTASTTPLTSTATTSSGSTSSVTAGSGAIICLLVPGKSQALYRVREQLASLNLPSDAIGTTQAITGTIIINPDGTVVSPQSKFSVDLSTLQSDRSQRDNFLRRAVLQTSQYPQAVFVPTQTTGFPSPLPQSGDVSFKLTGNLTIRDVTKPVTWDVTGKVENNTFTGKATTSFKFEDFNLNQPKIPIVLSIEDNINLEVDVGMQRASS